jgi:hypothetical protein
MGCLSFRRFSFPPFQILRFSLPIAPEAGNNARHSFELIIPCWKRKITGDS